MKNKVITVFICAAMVVGTMTGCGRADNNIAETSDVTENTNVGTESAEAEKEVGETEIVSSGETTEYPIVMEHAFGETTIESKPENVVTLSWGNQDTPLALGIIPTGVSAANYGLVSEHTLHLWTEEAFQDLGENEPNVFNDIDGFDYEAISEANPDVIIASYSGMTQEEYNMLSEIAPTVPYETLPYQTTWREQTILNATAMGMKTEGEALVEEVDALLEEKLSGYPEIAGTKAGFFWISPDDFSTFYAYLPTDPRAAFLNDLGMELPESIANLAEDNTEFSVTLSRENADMFEDVELMIVYGDEALLESLQADPLMSQIPAIANGAVVLLDSESALAAAMTPTILSIPYTIDEYLEVIEEARGKIK